MTKKKKAVRKTNKKKGKRVDEESPKLSINWRDWIVKIIAPRRLKYGRTFLYSAALIDLLGAFVIVVKAIKDTYWIWVITTFACALVISGGFIRFVVILATSLDGKQ